MIAGQLEIQLLANMARLQSDMNNAQRTVGSAMKNVEGAVSSAKSMLASLGIGVGLGSIIALGKEAIKQSEEAAQTQLRLNAVYKATGGVVGFTAEELNKMADAMQETTQFDDEAIRDGMAEIIKFGNITGEVFTKALKVIGDYAAFSKQDFATSAQAVSKALGDTEHATKLLKTAGVILTEAEKDLIKELNEAGKSADAQMIIIRKLDGAYGGMSAAMDVGITRSTRELGKAWDELLEKMGKAPRLGILIDDLTWILKALRTIGESPAMQGQSGQIKNAQGQTQAQLRQKEAEAAATALALEERQMAIGEKNLKWAEKNRQERIKQGIAEAKRIREEDYNQRLRELQDVINGEQELLQTKNDMEIKLADEARKEQQKQIDLMSDEAIKRAAEDARYFDEKVAMDEQLQREQEDLNAELIKDDKQRALAQLEIEHNRIVESIDLLHAEAAEKEELYAQEAINYELRTKKMMDAQNEMDNFAKTAAKNIQNSFADFLFDPFAKGTKGMLQGFIDAIRRMVAEALAAKLAKSLFGDVSSGGGLFGGIFNMFTSGSGGGNAAPGISLTPFASGTDYVPRDMPAMLHKGEAVITAEQNKSGKGKGVNVTYAPVVNIDSRSDRSEVEIMVFRAIQMGNADLVDKLARSGRIAS